jgi:hypothetical protein
MCRDRAPKLSEDAPQKCRGVFGQFTGTCGDGGARRSSFSQSDCPKRVDFRLVSGEKGVFVKSISKEMPIPKPSIEGDEFEPLMGPVEVAKLLGVSADWVRDHATRRSPRIPAVKLGRLLRFTAVGLLNFIGENHACPYHDDRKSLQHADHLEEHLWQRLKHQ